ncbi:MarR family winged helix-turn-helix transcriptional regulator [Sneathiella aquimaris]|uniref:MarR family winged helix-turn-helix transcriptional regulator n=1 Tax=Sneathiella aquimaris TaxID=2599305 RepID=UPI00146A0AED|nr:MarR family transcriptional regulator [Sneathiella aquimaris]
MIDLGSETFSTEDVPDGEKQRVRLWLRILKVSRAIEAELRERLRTRYKSTLPRFDVMSALYRHKDGLKMSELSAALMVSNGNVTGIIERLVGELLVERTPIPSDRRAMRVCLTEKGRHEFKAMARVHQGWINELLQDVNPDDAALISSLLDLNITTNRGNNVGGGDKQ